MTQKHIQSLLKKLPNTPGVYKLKNEEGRILYVGKAKNLNKRVRSYFRKQSGRVMRTKKLIEKTADIEWIEVGSDLEALFLETNLIKEYRPKYNVLMKDDKNFVYIKITKEEFPRIKIVRRVEKDGARYFGPKTAAGKVKKTLVLLQKLFMYRSCDLGMIWIGGNKPEKEKIKITKKTIAYPCLDYHIKRCAGPCIGKVSPEEYGQSIAQIERFLEGKTDEIEEALKQQMTECVVNKEFERAALLRDKLLSIQDLMQKQLVSSPDHNHTDVFGFVLDAGKAYFNLFMVRDGKLVNQENFIADAPGFEQGEEAQAEEVLESFLFQYYQKATDLPFEVLLPLELEEGEFLEDYLQSQVGRQVSLKVPQRGKKHKLIELAEKNAESFMKQHKARWAGFEQSDEDALQELGEVLGFEKPPKRMECFDISHLGGTDTVASMVVFEKGVPKKSDYRKFRLRSIAEGEIDDFKSMREVLNRRLLYLSKGPAGVKIRKAKGKAGFEAIAKLRMEWDGDDTMRGEVEEYYLAYLEKEVVGMVWMTEGKDDAYLLRGLFVSEAHRRRGIATGLMHYAIDKSKAKRVYLSCFKEKKAFYEGFGFEQVNQIPKYFTDLYLDYIRKKNPDREICLFAYDPNKHKDASFEAKPHLIVIDGGKGQLNAALVQRDALGLAIPMIGLAKREEDIYLEGQKEPLRIPQDSKASQLLQRLRDEAHRFAISFQKNSRKKHLTASSLDHVKGLGDAGKMKLLQHFGSVQKIQEASEEEIAKVVGAKMAKTLKLDF